MYRQAVKHPLKHMIWGYMAMSGMGKLYHCEGTVNATSYRHILKDSMLPVADKLFNNSSFVFMQDNAHLHMAKSTQSWFAQHGVHVLKWPPASPDLNPIENLWAKLKKSIRGRHPRNVSDLKQVLDKEWIKVTDNICKALIDSMPDCLQVVIDANGDATKY